MNDREEATEEEDCLAETLLGKLQFPPTPGKDEGLQAGDAAEESGSASKNVWKIRSEAAKKETE